jgi:P-type conjugative transfer protein TrbL
MRSNSNLARSFKWAILLGLLLLPCIAAAYPNSPNNILDSVAQTYQTDIKGISGTLNAYAQRLFLGLAIIGLIWNSGFLVLERADIGAFFATFIRWMLFVGFFWWLTQNGPDMASSIINSFAQIGASTGASTGAGSSIGPSTPINMAMMVDQIVEAKISAWHPIDSLGLIILDLVILLTMCVVAANMLITLCTCWIMIYAGQILLGFGAVKWTSDIAVNYFRTVLGISVTYMTMLILCAIGLKFFQQMVTGFGSSDFSYQQLFILIVCSTVLAFLVHKIPPLVGAMTGNHGGAHGSLGVGTAMSALAVAGAAAATGGASLAAGAAGGAKAIMAAVSAGSAAAGDGASNAGGGSLGGGGGGELASATGGAANDSNGGGAPLATAMGGNGTSGSTRGASVTSSVGAIGAAGMRIADAAVGGSGWTGGTRAPSSSVAGGSVGSAGAGVPPADAGGVAASEGAGGDVAAADGDADSVDAAATAGSMESPAPGSSGGSSGRSGPQRAAAFASGTVGALASGMGRQMAGRVSAMNERWQARVDNTMGGRLAQQIRSSGAAAQSGSPAPAPAAEAPTFSGDSISGNDEIAVDPAAEVAAFRDRSTT